MAQYPVSLSGVYDDVTNRITFTIETHIPPPPAEIGQGFWIPRPGIAAEFVISPQKKNAEPPKALYIQEGSRPVKAFIVEYKNGAWQMPGVPANPETGEPL
jgi:hypothetical protein